MPWNGNENGPEPRKRKNPWDKTPPDNDRFSGRPGGFGPNGAPNPDWQDFLGRARDMFGGNSGPGSGRLIGALLIVGILALWLGSGLYRVQPNEHAVIKRFGENVRVVSQPGLNYRLPWPVETVNKINVTLDRRIQLGFSENGRDIPEESLMLTADANIVDIDVMVLWNIADARNYLFNIRDQENTLKRVAESAIREVVGQTKLQPIITEGRDDVAARIQKIMQGILDSYNSGVSISKIQIRSATVHPDVTDAFRDVVAAIQDAQSFQNEASIYANDILPKARGEAIRLVQEAEAYKVAQIARATGDAKRFTSVLDAYRMGEDVTRNRIYIETMEQVLKNASKTIIGDDQGVVPYLPLSPGKATAAPAQ